MGEADNKYKQIYKQRFFISEHEKCFEEKINRVGTQRTPGAERSGEEANPLGAGFNTRRMGISHSGDDGSEGRVFQGMRFGNAKALAGRAIGMFTDHKVSQWMGYLCKESDCKSASAKPHGQ